jgi:hypothetical protein
MWGFLEQHPRVCMSRPKEVNVFARDDFEVNPYPFFEAPEQFLGFDWEREPRAFLETYAKAFQHHQPGQLLCDGTPSYFASRRAVVRMREQTPQAKVVILLRHPTERAYSQYWHQIRHRRAALPFEAYLRFERVNMRVGYYREHMERLYQHFAREQVLVLTSEELRRWRRSPSSWASSRGDRAALSRIPRTCRCCRACSSRSIH